MIRYHLLHFHKLDSWARRESSPNGSKVTSRLSQFATPSGFGTPLLPAFEVEEANSTDDAPIEFQEHSNEMRVRSAFDVTRFDYLRLWRMYMKVLWKYAA